MADPELDALTRRIHLVAYAATAGYQPSARERFPGLAFLEHPKTKDAIAVGRAPDGTWIYASLAACAPRPPHESHDEARTRLHEGIARTAEKGSVVEFEQHRYRVEGGRELSIEQVRERLRAWQSTERRLDPELHRPADVRAPPPQPEPQGVPRAGPLKERVGDGRNPLAQRRYDWSRPPFGPEETHLRDRLRRSDEAQRHIDETLGRPARKRIPLPAIDRNADGGAPPRGSAVERAPGRASNSQSPLNQRHYDWTPAGGAGGPRRAGPERGR